MKTPPFADRSLLGTCIQLAQTAFYEALPANVEQRAPVAPRALSPKRAPQRTLLQRGLAALDGWFYRQRQASREEYLSRAQNVFELEARMRELERSPHF